MLSYVSWPLASYWSCCCSYPVALNEAIGNLGFPALRVVRLELEHICTLVLLVLPLNSQKVVLSFQISQDRYTHVVRMNNYYTNTQKHTHIHTQSLCFHAWPLEQHICLGIKFCVGELYPHPDRKLCTEGWKSLVLLRTNCCCFVLLDHCTTLDSDSDFISQHSAPHRCPPKGVNDTEHCGYPCKLEMFHICSYTDL